MADSGVTPQIVVGDVLTGYGAEPVRNGLNKYNHHDHSKVSAGSFLIAGVKPGMTVEPVTACDEPLLTAGTFVERVRENYLELNKPILKTGGGIFKYTEPDGNIIYVIGCFVIQGQYIVNVNKRFGFISSGQLIGLSTEIITSTVLVTSNNYPLILSAPFEGYIKRMVYKCVFGSCDLLLKSSREGVTLFEKALPAAGASRVNVEFISHSNTDNTLIRIGSDTGLEVSPLVGSTILFYQVELVRFAAQTEL